VRDSRSLFVDALDISQTEYSSPKNYFAIS
jgi:hypothetical protein